MRTLTLTTAIALATAAPLASAATFDRVALTGETIDLGGSTAVFNGFQHASIGPGG